MVPRKYKLDTRRRKQADLKARIAAATAELHATRGIAQTSYADIARHADVSPPTVYSHFPTQDDLFLGCTEHAIEHAPVFPLEQIMSAANLADAIDKLAAAFEQQHRYYEPWSAQRMEGYVPFLAKMFDQVRMRQTGLIDEILQYFLGRGRRRKAVAACETLLSFDCWHRLVRAHGLASSQARQVIVQGLLVIVEAEAASPSANITRRKSS